MPPSELLHLVAKCIERKWKLPLNICRPGSSPAQGCCTCKRGMPAGTMRFAHRCCLFVVYKEQLVQLIHGTLAQAPEDLDFLCWSQTVISAVYWIITLHSANSVQGTVHKFCKALYPKKTPALQICYFMLYCSIQRYEQWKVYFQHSLLNSYTTQLVQHLCKAHCTEPKKDSLPPHNVHLCCTGSPQPPPCCSLQIICYQISDTL